MRKIDTTSFNKRLFAEITELGSLLDRINPEHIKYFDSDLIETAESYVKLIKESRWQSNSNFNSIEMSKIKQAINYIKSQKSKLFAQREIVSISESTDGYGYSAFGVHLYRVPENYDGRESFVYPRIIVKELVEDEGSGTYSFRYLNASEILLATQVTETPNYKLAVYGGNANSRLEIVKNKHEISIHYDINCRDSVLIPNDPLLDPSIVPSTIEDIFLDAFYVMWRKK